MSVKSGEIDQYFNVSGFWSYVRRAIALDKELLIYFFLYGSISVLTIPAFFYVTKFAVTHSSKGLLGLGCLGVFFFSVFVTRFFQFAIAYTVLEREEGTNPNLFKTFAFTVKNFGLIFSLSALNLAFTFIVSLITGVVGSVFKRGGEAVSCWFMNLIFSIGETTFQVLMGFAVPVAVFTKERSILGLMKKTAGVIRGHLLASLSISYKLQLLFVLWFIPFVASFAVLPGHVSQTTLRFVWGSELYFIVLVAQAVGLCTTLVYSRIVYLALMHRLPPERLKLAISQMGAKTRS